MCIGVGVFVSVLGSTAAGSGALIDHSSYLCVIGVEDTKQRVMVEGMKLGCYKRGRKNQIRFESPPLESIGVLTSRNITRKLSSPKSIGEVGEKGTTEDMKEGEWKTEKKI